MTPTAAIWLILGAGRAPVLVQDGLEFYRARTLARKLNEIKTTRKAYFTVCLGGN